VNPLEPRAYSLCLAWCIHPPKRMRVHAKSRRHPIYMRKGIFFDTPQPQRSRIRRASLLSLTMPNVKAEYQALLTWLPVSSRSWSHAGCEVITDESVVRDAGHSRSRRPAQQYSDVSSCFPVKNPLSPPYPMFGGAGNACRWQFLMPLMLITGQELPHAVGGREQRAYHRDIGSLTLCSVCIRA
jgi:hypothetical protein